MGDRAQTVGLAGLAAAEAAGSQLANGARTPAGPATASRWCIGAIPSQDIGTGRASGGVWGGRGQGQGRHSDRQTAWLLEAKQANLREAAAPRGGPCHNISEE